LKKLETTFTVILALALFASALAVVLGHYLAARTCEDQGGIYVKGLLGMQCIQGKEIR